MSLVIFDFDDTLFPTTYFQHHQDLTSKDLKELNYAINKLLNVLLSKRFDIVLVSNGSLDWIDSSAILLPSLYNLLIRNVIRCVSARDIYEHTGIHYEDWKRFAIVNILTSKPYYVTKKVIGIGDSEVDRTAISDACKYTHKKFNFIKFAPEMSLEVLTATIKDFTDYCMKNL